MAKKNVNLGKQLEDKIIKTNEYYDREGIAYIHKVPNAWVVKRKGPHIVGANPVPSGLCDFYGTSPQLNGRLIVFDAKETKNKTSFPLKNIKHQQMDQMERVTMAGGLAFLVVWFTESNEAFYAPYDFIAPYWDMAEQHPGVRGYQSIKLKDFRERCELILDMDYMGQVMNHHRSEL